MYRAMETRNPQMRHVVLMSFVRRSHYGLADGRLVAVVHSAAEPGFVWSVQEKDLQRTESRPLSLANMSPKSKT